MRRALCPAGPLPPASAALLKELQPQDFVDSGFVSGYLQPNLELGRVLLANLLGIELHDVALDRFVEVAARLSPILTLTIPILTLVATLTIPIGTLAATRTLT